MTELFGKRATLEQDGDSGDIETSEYSYYPSERSPFSQRSLPIWLAVEGEKNENEIPVKFYRRPPLHKRSWAPIPMKRVSELFG